MCVQIKLMKERFKMSHAAWCWFVSKLSVCCIWNMMIGVFSSSSSASSLQINYINMGLID